MLTVVCQFCGRHSEKEGSGGHPSHGLCVPCLIKHYKKEMATDVIASIARNELIKNKDRKWLGSGAPDLDPADYELYSKITKEVGVPIDAAVRTTKERFHEGNIPHGGRRVAA